MDHGRRGQRRIGGRTANRGRRGLQAESRRPEGGRYRKKTIWGRPEWPWVGTKDKEAKNKQSRKE